MQIRETEKYLNYIEAGYILTEPSIFLDKAKEFSPDTVLHHKDNIIFRLEGIFEID